MGEQYPVDVMQHELYHMFERMSEVLTGSALWDNKIVKNAGGTDRPRRGNYSRSSSPCALPPACKMDATTSWWQVEQAVWVKAQLIEVLKYESCLCSRDLAHHQSVMSEPVSPCQDKQISTSGTGQLSYDPCNQGGNQGHFILTYCFLGRINIW